MADLLTVEGLSVAFGGVQALDGFSFRAPAGRITALIGPNGAGKTTAINCISGVVPPDRGRVEFAGREVTGLAGHSLARRGLTRTFQNLQVFGQMDVLENVMVGLHAATHKEFLTAMFRLPGMRREEKSIREEALAALEVVGLVDQAGKPARELAYGDQKRIELARALVGRPRMLLLDEPVAGLNPQETEAMGSIILKARERGMGLVLVEHDMALVVRVSDQVVVLAGGRKIAEGTPHDIQHHPEVISVYLGGGEEFGLCA